MLPTQLQKKLVSPHQLCQNLGAQSCQQTGLTEDTEQLALPVRGGVPLETASASPFKGVSDSCHPASVTDQAMVLGRRTSKDTEAFMDGVCPVSTAPKLCLAQGLCPTQENTGFGNLNLSKMFQGDVMVDFHCQLDWI